MEMKTKKGQNIVLKSMKDFERIYYPNNLAHTEQMSTSDHNLGKKLANESFMKIKKKYNIICQ